MLKIIFVSYNYCIYTRACEVLLLADMKLNIIHSMARGVYLEAL